MDAQVKRLLDGAWAVSFPYDPDVVELFKELIPWKHRKWQPTLQAWWISDLWLLTAVTVLEDSGYDVLGFPTKSKTASVISNPFDSLWTAIPKQLQGKAYRSLAQALHPDAGGENDIMRLLNNSYANRKDRQ